MKLIVTIDTEEDNWGEFNLAEYSVKNINRIPILQDLFDDFGVKPTYLITYPVATNARAISILGNIAAEERCEIASHCHPWNTPPFEEEKNQRNSMLCNLPADLQYKKISFLHNTILKEFGIVPVSFRAGRWGYSHDVARNLYKRGYKIDTSISPYTDWTSYYGPDFSNVSPKPFRLPIENCTQGLSAGHLVEIPATVGFLQKDFSRCNNLLQKIKSRPIKYLRLTGNLNRLRLVNKVWLNPEISDSKKMIRLAQMMMINGYGIINMMFHSTSFKACLTPFVKTKYDESEFIQRIKKFLIFSQNNGIEPIKLSEALELI